MAGQADSAPTFDDIAELLVDNPEADLPHENVSDQAGEPSDEDNPQGDPADEPEGEPDPDEDDPDAEEGDEDDEPAPDDRKAAKYEVTIKGDDGAEVKQKVSLEELTASYMRHSDYTRKTQELGTQRQQAMEIVSRKEAEARTHYQNEAAIALRTVYELAGIMSPEEMAALAASDPQAAFQEQARQQAVLARMEQVRGRVLADREQGTAQQQQQQAEAAQKAWEVLENPGALGLKMEPVKKEDVEPLFREASQLFKIPFADFQNVVKPQLVLMMRSAVAFEKARIKTAENPKGARVAQPAKPQARQIPPPRQSAPRESRAAQKLDRTFSSGRATTRDLASWIASNS